MNRVRLCLRQADSFGDAFARTPQARPRRDPGGSNPEKSNSQDLSCAATHGETWLIERMSTDLEEGMAVSVTLDRTAYGRLEPADVVTFGAFQFAGHVPFGKIADFYGLPVAQAEKATPVGDFLAGRLPAKPAVGDLIEIGTIGLVVHDVSGERITRVGLEL